MVNVNGACLMMKWCAFLDVLIGFLKMNEDFKLQSFIFFNGLKWDTSLLNLGQCWTLGKQLRSIRISSGFRKDSSRSSISSGSSWNAFFSFTEELWFPVSNFDEDFIFCLVSCVWTWSSSTWTIFSSFRMFWMLLLLLECAMVTKLCCFCCRPQSTRHLTHLFTVRTIAINSIENVESKCACTLVTGTHKCFFFSVYCVNCLWQLSLCGYTTS